MVAGSIPPSHAKEPFRINAASSFTSQEAPATEELPQNWLLLCGSMSSLVQTPARPLPGAFLQSPAARLTPSSFQSPPARPSRSALAPIQSSPRAVATISNPEHELQPQQSGPRRTSDSLQGPTPNERGARTINDTLLQESRFPELESYLTRR